MCYLCLVIAHDVITNQPKEICSMAKVQDFKLSLRRNIGLKNKNNCQSLIRRIIKCVFQIKVENFR